MEHVGHRDMAHGMHWFSMEQ